MVRLKEARRQAKHIVGWVFLYFLLYKIYIMKNSTIYVAFLPLLLVASLMFSPNSTASGTSGSSNGFVVGHTVNVSNYTVTNANQSQINTAKNYLQGRLGMGYFDSYINYSVGSVYNNIAYLSFSYKIPFSNGTTTSGVYGGVSPVLRLLNIVVEIGPNGNVVAYSGPSIPYVINITKGSAIVMAAQRGILNGTAGIQGALLPNATSLQGYSVVLAVRSGNPAYIGGTNYYNRVYKGVYVDVETGSILGEFVYNPAIVTPASSGQLASLGNFALFPINGTIATSTIGQTNNTAKGASLGVSPRLVFSIIIVLVIIVILGFFGSRMMKGS